MKEFVSWRKLQKLWDLTSAMDLRSKYIVSDEHRFVYFVVQKVACTSIKTALAPLFGIDTARAEALQREARPHFIIHRIFRDSGYQVSRDEFLASPRYDDYFKFAFVRNPWGRLVSCYSDKIVGQTGNVGLVAFPGLRRGMPFDEFVRAVHAVPDGEANSHFRSQHVSLCGPDERIIPDFVGRFENLHEDFARVVREIGTPEIKLPHILRSERGPAYRELYDGDTAALAGERYERDAELFGYAFPTM